MALITACIGILLLVTTVLLPWTRVVRQRQEIQFNKRVQDFKLYAVKHYHPAFQNIEALKQMDYSQISARYDVNRLYDQIGR